MNKDNSKQFYLVSEVAEILRVNKMTIYRYIESKKIPAYKLGKDYRIKKDDLMNFLEQSKV